MSTPQYFIDAWKATPEQAADLSQQAMARNGSLGRDAKIAAEHSLDGWAPPPPTSPDPQPTAQQLSDMAESHDAAQANASLAQHYARPESPRDYRVNYGVDSPTDEMIAFYSAIQDAAHAEHLPQSMFELLQDDLAKASRTLANESPAQMQSRLDGNWARLTAMWQKSGEGTFDSNMEIIDKQIEQWSKNPVLRAVIERDARFLSPLHIDEILQFAKRASRRS
jgi:hypothetical protein